MLVGAFNQEKALVPRRSLLRVRSSRRFVVSSNSYTYEMSKLSLTAGLRSCLWGRTGESVTLWTRTTGHGDWSGWVPLTSLLPSPGLHRLFFLIICEKYFILEVICLDWKTSSHLCDVGRNVGNFLDILIRLSLCVLQLLHWRALVQVETVEATHPSEDGVSTGGWWWTMRILYTSGQWSWSPGPTRTIDKMMTRDESDDNFPINVRLLPHSWCKFNLWCIIRLWFYKTLNFSTLTE